MAKQVDEKQEANHVDVKDEIHGLRERLKLFGVQVASCLIDLLFVAAWVSSQWCVREYLIEPLQLKGFDRWALVTFQFVFAIATLVTVLCFVVLDLQKVIRRTYHAMKAGASPPRPSVPAPKTPAATEDEPTGDGHA